jgi:CDP-diacylglycerol--serine O-phosphatidyltransferase
LDSLADMVTSGLVPGLVLFYLLGLAPQPSWESSDLLPYFGLWVTLASAYRLAKFNISTNQSDAFIGLPTPANTLLIISLPLILEYQNSDAINAIILNPWFLIVLTLVSCYLLNAPIKLIALKFKTWSFKDNATRYILIILSLVFLAVFQFAGIPLIIIAYFLLSIVSK